MSRDTDIFVSNLNRAQEANELEVGAFISIHHNSDPNPSTQYTVAFYCSTSYVPGTFPLTARNKDYKLAYKCALNIQELFKYDLGWGPPKGLGQANFDVLNYSYMPSALVEASFISDSTEEENFYYNRLFHREQEASAIFDAFLSWSLGQGFGKVDYAYAGQMPTDSHKVRVQDYLTVEFNTNDTFYAPYIGVWNLDQAIRLTAINFNQYSYGYQFHHWEHKNHFDSTIIFSYPIGNPVWEFYVDSAQDSTHWYVAYFKGGPFDAYSDTVGQMNIGSLDTIQWECDPGVEGTGQVIIQLTRNNGGSWTTLDTVPYNGMTGNYSHYWTVTGPATQLARFRFIAYDYVDNKDTDVTYIPFVICDGAADADCDGDINSVDNCPTVANSNQQDTDGDGDGNVCDNCVTVANANQANVDGDTLGDLCDNCPDSVQDDQSDIDGDLLGDFCDNCVGVANNNQADSDADGFGNVCDNCPDSANPNQSDIDGDGLGDVCDTVLNWQMTYNLIPDKVAYSVRQDQKGGYTLCGHTQYPPGPFSNDRQLNLIRLNSAGAVQIDKDFIGLGIETGNCVRERPDSTYVAIGSTTTYGAGGPDMFLIKTTRLLWAPYIYRTFGGAGEDAARHVELTSDGGCIIAGYTKSFGAGNADFYIVKTNSAFDLQWSKTFGGTNADYAQAIQPIVGGGYTVAGTTNSFGAGNSDMYLIKLNTNGDSVWSKTFGFSGSDSLFSMQQTIDKGFVLAGSTNSIGAGLSDMYVVRTDSLGNVVWSRTYGGSNADGVR
ncbi:MAG: N-acetylmuramoyl-L-alanine amidase, partial [Candidatus Zixiibacteriota bacterium]